MNIFMPEKVRFDSVRALDDARLNKQISECLTILNVALRGQTGYSHHPVVKYYKDYPHWVAAFGMMCCAEYYIRQHKIHGAQGQIKLDFDDTQTTDGVLENPKSFYCQGKKTDPDHIRTFDNTVELFRNRLCWKWDHDKRTPTWTNREPPVWYKRKEI